MPQGLSRRNHAVNKILWLTEDEIGRTPPVALVCAPSRQGGLEMRVRAPFGLLLVFGLAVPALNTLAAWLQSTPLVAWPAGAIS